MISGERDTGGGPSRRFAKAWRWLQAPVLSLAILVLALCAAGRAAQGATPPVQIPAGEIYVISNGWHTEIGVPASALNGPLAIIRSRFPGASYFAFGWGERTFYMNPDPTWTEALRALFPARAVLLVLALPTVPSQAFVKGIQVMAVPVSEAGIAALMHYVWRSFARLGGGPERLAAGPYPESAFYAAMGTYDGRHTCNTWTADALREAGLAVKTAGVVFAGQVTRQVRALQDERSAEQSLR